jgi:hypothetical protein
MRDDDEPFDEDPSLGKIYHSGIRREDEIGPADYALEPGVEALQEPMPDDDEDSLPAATSKGFDRRAVLAMGLGGLLTGTVAFLVGRLSTPAVASPERPRRLPQTGTVLTQDDLKLIRACKTWASGPVEDLANNAMAFLWVFAVIEPDEILRHGLSQLCEYAILHRAEEKGYEAAVSVLASFEEVGPPSGFEHYQAKLQDVVWRWQTTKKRRGR